MLEHNKRAQNEAIWIEHIKAWEQSGLTLIAYCLEHKINKSTLYYWRDRLKKKPTAASTTFIPIRTHSFASPVQSEYLIVKFSSIIMQIPTTMDTNNVIKLLRALGQAHD